MVRVRIAPSPTGEPHIGNIRTAVFNWLFAKSRGGKFIVRIEDTDRERFDPRSKNAILESLRWLGLTWDEGPEAGGRYGPYVQSQRRELYQAYARELVKKGFGYFCFCTKERLAKMRIKQQEERIPPRYDRRCRRLSPKETEERIAAGEKAVVRLKVPLGGKTSWVDLIHGKIEFRNEVVDDQVLLKSDGFPTYHLAVVVDDYLMKISHVLRADEWVSSTPKQILLYQFFGWPPPAFGHLPMVLGPDKSKLSKRHGATSILRFRDEGYLPEAVFNYLALLGWAYDDKTEIFSRKELIEKFDLKKINPRCPIFDYQKLEWMNGVYIRQLSADELKFKIKNQIAKTHIKNQKDLDKYLEKIIPLVQERMRKLSDFEALADFFFAEEVEMNPQLLATFGATPGEVKQQITTSYDKLQQVTVWKAEEIEKVIRGLVEENRWRPSRFFMALRLVLTGKKISPPLFGTMAVLGKVRTLSRLKEAADSVCLFVYH